MQHFKQIFVDIMYKLKFIMHVDDTTIFFNFEDLIESDINNSINCELSKVNTSLKLSK